MEESELLQSCVILFAQLQSFSYSISADLQTYMTVENIAAQSSCTSHNMAQYGVSQLGPEHSWDVFLK